jgi:CHASE3 domain sensor protein
MTFARWIDSLSVRSKIAIVFLCLLRLVGGLGAVSLQQVVAMNATL